MLAPLQLLGPTPDTGFRQGGLWAHEPPECDSHCCGRGGPWGTGGSWGGSPCQECQREKSTSQKTGLNAEGAPPRTRPGPAPAAPRPVSRVPDPRESAAGHPAGRGDSPPPAPRTPLWSPREAAPVPRPTETLPGGFARTARPALAPSAAVTWPGRVGEGDARQGIPGVGAKAPRRVRRAVSTGGVWAPEPRVLTELVQATGDQGYDSDPQRPPPSITPRSTTPATPSSTVWGPSDPFQPKPPTRRPPDTAGPGLPECSLPQPARGAWA